jgi:hypothetical protein
MLKLLVIVLFSMFLIGCTPAMEAPEVHGVTVITEGTRLTEIVVAMDYAQWSNQEDFTALLEYHAVRMQPNARTTAFGGTVPNVITVIFAEGCSPEGCNMSNHVAQVRLYISSNNPTVARRSVDSWVTDSVIAGVCRDFFVRW